MESFEEWLTFDLDNGTQTHKTRTPRPLEQSKGEARGFGPNDSTNLPFSAFCCFASSEEVSPCWRLWGGVCVCVPVTGPDPDFFLLPLPLPDWPITLLVSLAPGRVETKRHEGQAHLFCCSLKFREHSHCRRQLVIKGTKTRPGSYLWASDSHGFQWSPLQQPGRNKTLQIWTFYGKGGQPGG